MSEIHSFLNCVRVTKSLILIPLLIYQLFIGHLKLSIHWGLKNE